MWRKLHERFWCSSKCEFLLPRTPFRLDNLSLTPFERHLTLLRTPTHTCAPILILTHKTESHSMSEVLILPVFKRRRHRFGARLPMRNSRACSIRISMAIMFGLLQEPPVKATKRRSTSCCSSLFSWNLAATRTAVIRRSCDSSSASTSTFVANHSLIAPYVCLAMMICRFNMSS